MDTTPARLIKVDRSRIVARQDCPMMRYWNYHHGGLGIVPRAGGGDALDFGIALHKAMEFVLKSYMDGHALDIGTLEAQYINPFCTQVFNKLFLHGGASKEKADHVSKEQAHLLRMLVGGWIEFRLPALLNEYSIVGVEKEYEVPFPHRPEVTLMLRVDAVLRRKADGVLFILDFKTLKYLSDDWMVAHENSLQTLLYLWALEKAEEEYVGGVLYEGLLKGGSRKETNKAVPWSGWEVAQTPLCYVYTNGLDYRLGWTSATGWRKESVIGWPYYRLIDLLKGFYAPKGETLPFWPNVPPVRPTNAQVKQVVDSLAEAEWHFDNTIASIRKWDKADSTHHLATLHRRLHIPQHLGRCYKYGTKYGCPYTSLCHGGADPEDPTLWVPRTPHHDTETTPDATED